MAVFQSMFNFFLPSRRRAPLPSPATPQQAELMKGLEAAFAAIDELSLPDQIAENFKADLTDSLNIGTPITSFQGAYPGTLKRLRFNLVKVVQDPIGNTLGVLGEYVQSYGTDLKDWIDPDYYQTRVWGPVLKQFVDPQTGLNLLSTSTRFRLADWGAAATVSRRMREGVEVDLWQKGKERMELRLQDDPGLIDTWAGELMMASPDLEIGGVPIGSIRAQTNAVRGRLDTLYMKKTSLAAVGKWEEADALADQIREELVRFNKWFVANGINPSDVTSEFEQLVRTNPGISNSSVRLYKSLKQQRTYYRVFDFLKTWHRDGASGLFREYAWREFINRAFKRGSWREYLYPPNIIRSAVGKITKRGMKAVAKGIRVAVSKFRSQIVSKLSPVIRKLISKVLGAAGMAAVPATGPLGPVIAAAINFIVSEIIVKNIGGVLKIVGYVLAGVIGCFALFAIGIVTLISIFLSNIPYPWEKAALLEIDCNQSATATDNCVLSKSAVKDIADRWGTLQGIKIKSGDNNVEACYNDVIAKSKAAGVDPRISMTVWLHESVASNYELYKQLGELPEDFGIPSRAGEGFTAQIGTFLNFYKQSRTSYSACYEGKSDAEGFFRVFCTAGRANLGVGQCPDLTDTGEECVDDLMMVYSWIDACK